MEEDSLFFVNNGLKLITVYCIIVNVSSSIKWYLLFLWDVSQVQELISIVTRGRIQKFVIIHPILNASVQNNNVNIVNIVTISYLRGFAYYLRQQLSQINIIYTGIGCHKIGGILAAIQLPENDLVSVLKDVYKPINQVHQQDMPLLITVNDIPIDFFSVARIKTDDIKQNLSRIDQRNRLEIDRRPVITFQGKVDPKEFHTKTIEYSDFDQGLTYIRDLIQLLLSNLRNLTSTDTYVLYTQDPQRGDLNSLYLRNCTISSVPSTNDLENRIKDLFITKPKEIKLR